MIEESLPGCISYGESIDRAMTMAQEAIELYVGTLQAEGRAIPDDSRTL